jgi:hypothetical protein
MTQKVLIREPKFTTWIRALADVCHGRIDESTYGRAIYSPLVFFPYDAAAAQQVATATRNPIVPPLSRLLLVAAPKAASLPVVPSPAQEMPAEGNIPCASCAPTYLPFGKLGK